MRLSGLMMVLLALLAGSVVGASASENLVLHRSYELWPPPNYRHTLDEEGDPVHLTDGYTNYTVGRIWMDQSTVGWIVPLLKTPLVILFDLEQPATLSELRFYTTGGGPAGVVEPEVRVYVSLDDESYVLAAERGVPEPEELDQGVTRGLVKQVPLSDALARYVAVVATPPYPYEYAFVDEIEIMGTIPAEPASALPARPAVRGSGAQGLQEALFAGRRATDLMESLLALVRRHVQAWPEEPRAQQQQDMKELVERSMGEPDQHDLLRAEATERHRLRAREVYGADTLVWEVIPDDTFGPLFLPETLPPPAGASVETVINALEATALGAANLTDGSLPLSVSVSGGEAGAPQVTPRVARLFVTTNATYVADALIATDSPHAIPSGESRLIWLSVDSEDAVPGDHQYEVRVEIGGDAHLVPLTVRVHDVTLSDSTPLNTGNWSYLDRGQDSPAITDLRESMLAHRMTVGACTSGSFPSPRRDEDGNVIRPLQLDFTSLNAALDFHQDFPQMSWFWPSVPHFGAEWMSEEFQSLFAEWLTQSVAHLRARGRDYDGFYLQFFDETLDSKVAEICRLVKRIDPQVRLMITWYGDTPEESLRELLEAGMDIFVWHGLRLTEDNAPYFFPLVLSAGREMWVYHAVSRGTGHGRERDPLDAYRLLHWLAFYHGVTGVHFWNMWENATSGWEDDTPEPQTQYYPPVYLNAEGHPPAPDDVQTAEMVIPSRRWEYRRMGIEDYMLLSMAQARVEELGPAGEEYGRRLEGIVDDVLGNRVPRGGTELGGFDVPDRGLFRARRRELIALVQELEALTAD